MASNGAEKKSFPTNGIFKKKKKPKKGSPKKKKSTTSVAEVPQDKKLGRAAKDSSSIEPIILGPLTADAFPTIEVKFLSSRIDNLDAKSDRASGYMPTIRYWLDTAKKSITRATDASKVDLLRVKTSSLEIIPGDRVFSLKGKDVDFLLRNGNAIYPLFEEGWTSDELPIEEIVKSLREIGIPPYRQLSSGEIRGYLPDEKKTLTNAFFYVQAPNGEHVIVRVNERKQCRAMTALSTRDQQEAFENFKEFHDTCPIFMVKTPTDFNFIQAEENFTF